MQKKLIVLLVLVVPIYVFIRYFGSSDAFLSTLYDTSGNVRSYTMKAETEVLFPEKTLSINGLYAIDSTKHTYSSTATTSLITRNRGIQRFSLQNIVVNEDVYVRIDATDSSLQKTLPSYGKWLHFKTGSIPPSFANIAVPGPVLDNLLLLSEDGKYLSLVEKMGADLFNGTSTVRVRFRLSGAKPKGSGGPLHALLTRIGDDGVIDIWAHENGAVEGMHFSNKNYRSTTTIISLLPPTFTPPQLGL